MEESTQVRHINEHTGRQDTAFKIKQELKGHIDKLNADGPVIEDLLCNVFHLQLSASACFQHFHTLPSIRLQDCKIFPLCTV